MHLQGLKLLLIALILLTPSVLLAKAGGKKELVLTVNVNAQGTVSQGEHKKSGSGDSLHTHDFTSKYSGSLSFHGVYHYDADTRELISSNTELSGNGGGGGTSTDYDAGSRKKITDASPTPRTTTSTFSSNVTITDKTPHRNASDSIDIDFDSGEYSFSMPASSFAPLSDEVSGTMTTNTSDSYGTPSLGSTDPTTQDLGMAAAINALSEGLTAEALKSGTTARFDPKAPSISIGGSYSGSYQSPPKPPGSSMEESVTGSMNLQWSLNSGVPSKVKAVIIPKGDYASWLPSAGTTSGAVGNKIAFDIELRDSLTDAKVTDKTARFTIVLVGTSKEPGSCMNSPWTDTDLDMQILKDDNQSLENIAADGQSCTSKDKVSSCTVNISCFDGGGYTSLKVKAHIDGQEDVPAYLQNGKGEEEVKIPRDDDGNHIADAWEKDKGVEGKDPSLDEDNKPAGEQGTGDGLTIWEEYRGFLEDGSFIRTDPEQKDFFICDTIGGRTKAGINLFESLSKLKVHSNLQTAELGDSRIINRNHSDKAPHEVDQHGVKMVSWSTRGLCEAEGGPGTPGKISRVLIDTKWNDLKWVTQTNGDTTPYASFIPTVAHELLHCCNVWHHGELDEHVWWHRETRPGSDMVYEFKNKADCGHPEKGTLVLVDSESGASYLPVNWDVPMAIWLGISNGQHSGNEDCVMRYHCSQASANGPTIRYCFIWEGQERAGQHLCKSPDGTGVNDLERKPASRYRMADEGRGDCADKICVNDKYQGGL